MWPHNHPSRSGPPRLAAPSNLRRPVAAGITFTDKGVEFRKGPPKAYVPIGIKHGKK